MHANRINRIRDRMADEGLDALMVTALPNIFYLSGYTGSTAVVLLTQGNCWFLTDFRYHEQFEQQVWNGYTLVDNTGRKFVEDILPSLADAKSIKRIGFEAAHATYTALQKLQVSSELEFTPTMGWVEDLRIIKDEKEIELLRASVRLNEQVFEASLRIIGPDATEADLAAEIHYQALKLGAKGYSFDPIIASGPNSSKPHAGFSLSKLVPGAPLTIDMGVVLDGYCSDMTRTVFYKDCPADWAKIYQLVREAKDRAFAAIRPGKLGKEIDAVARDLIYKAGYEGKFEHGLGHGVGIEVHEQPTLSRMGEQELKPGMVVSDEPGIYLPGQGGIRIEDMVVVRENGAENLNELATELRIVG
ncbi:aminopeptidase P family protein [bacterium]|nr:aminopeptidase P family protein [bacterium]